MRATVTPDTTPPLESITGLDFVALLLLLHVWLIAVLLTYYQDGPFDLGIDWADRRIDLNWRSLAVLWLAATVVAWLPFALGEYPWPSRPTLFLAVGGGAMVWGGFYFLGGLVATLRSYAAIAAGESAPEVGVAAESGSRVHRDHLETIAGCALATAALTGGGVWLLWALAGH